MIIEYVDEDELKTIDLFSVKIRKEDLYDEYYIQDPININRRWIVLPSNWFNKSLSNGKQHYYIFDDEVNNKLNVIYKDAQKRRFIVDKKTNIKYYLVPRVNDYRQSFKFKWAQIDHEGIENKKKVLTLSKPVQTSSKTTTVEIVELPGSPRPLHYAMIEQKKMKNHSDNRVQTNPKIRQRSASTDKVLDERLTPRVAKQHEAQIYGQQRSNSSDDLLLNEQARSQSGRVKKSVYFNENVKVSDGQTAAHTIAPLAVPLKYEKHFPSIRQETTNQPPAIKPREIKPMTERIDFNGLDSSTKQVANMKPFSYTNNNNIYKTQHQSGQVLRIKQNGRPGHVVHTNKTS
jgi:hypothetical protein